MVFARLGDNSIIDVVSPRTGCGQYGGQTLAQVQKEYPGACVMQLAEYCADKAKRQQTPIEWLETTEEKLNDALDALPPAAMAGTWFLLGEPQDHCAATGQPRYDCYRQTGERCEYSSRPITVREFRKLRADLKPSNAEVAA